MPPIRAQRLGQSAQHLPRRRGAALFSRACVVALTATSLLALSACTTLERATHAHSEKAAVASAFAFRDGAVAHYYPFRVPLATHRTGTAAPVAATGDADPSDTALFILGGSGCASWKGLMPHYVQGFSRPAHVFALNKRHIDDRSLGILPCGARFHASNHMTQWVADYEEMMRAALATLPQRPRHVILVGVSEGALPAARIAAKTTLVTHLGLIGFGGWSIMRSLEQVYAGRQGEMNANEVRRIVATAPRSLTDEVYGHPYRWWTDVADIDPMPDLLSLRIPVVVGMGDADINVPSAAAQAIAARFREQGKSNLQVLLFPGADHRLAAPGKTYRDDYFSALAAAIR